MGVICPPPRWERLAAKPPRRTQVSVERIASRLPCRSCEFHCLPFAWSEGLCVRHPLSVHAVQFLQDDAEKDPRTVT